MKFKKKTVIVEAEQFFFDKKPWPEGVEEDQLGTVLGCNKNVIHLKISEHCKAFVYDGDWIITDADGKMSLPCKSDIFEAIYEKVE